VPVPFCLVNGRNSSSYASIQETGSERGGRGTDIEGGGTVRVKGGFLSQKYRGEYPGEEGFLKPAERRREKKKREIKDSCLGRD